MTMPPNFAFEKITAQELLERTRVLKADGYRLVQIGAARLVEELELTYSFDRESTLLNLRLTLAGTELTVPSISAVYWCAFLYENELHDLFGVEVQGLEVDFHGNLYRTSVKFPFGSIKAPLVAPDPPSSPQVSSAHRP